MNDNGINNKLVKTGTKYAHPAVKDFDIGANDEPNGHGTVSYKPAKIAEALQGIDSIEAKKLNISFEIASYMLFSTLKKYLVGTSSLWNCTSSVLRT